MEARLPVEARREIVRAVVDPCSVGRGVPISLEEMGLVKDIRVDGDEVVVELRLTHPVCFQAINILDEVERRAEDLGDGLTTRVTIDYASEWWPEMMSDDARTRLAVHRPHPLRDRPRPGS